MSNLVDRLRNDGSGYHEKTIDVLNDPNKRYRTLYFENLVDVRLCTKNGNTTLRNVWSQLFTGEDVHCSTSTRKHLIHETADLGILEPGGARVNFFRKHSYRVAVKRDPIDRALSAAKYLCKVRLGIEDPDITLVEELLSIASSEVDHHFLPQTYWMGSINLYDEVYDLQTLNVMIEWLEQDFDYKYPVTVKMHNVSSKSINVSHLSDSTIKRLYKMYEIDYDNGWY